MPEAPPVTTAVMPWKRSLAIDCSRPSFRSPRWALSHRPSMAPTANCGQAPTEDFETLAPTVPLEISVGGSTLTLFNTITTFGTPQDVALHELRIEMAFPADSKTDLSLRALRGA